jgi:hypothetical protein
VELDEFHVLQRQAGAQHHGIAIARTGVSGGTGEEGAAITAGREDDFLGAEAVQRAVIQLPGCDAAAGAVSSMIRSMAKYSMKNSVSSRTHWP